MMTLREVSAMDRQAFVSAFGGIFEDSPWVARRAWDSRPFASREALHRAMTQQVESAAREEQLALLRAHPDLGARARMSAVSTSEQRGAGLDQLTPEEYEQLTAWNQAYRDRFGFPFLFAVKGAGKTAIMEALRSRAFPDPGADTEAEFAEALAQVYRIAWFRLEAAVHP
jgi:2-oxo-4-hydroxy-4-carboxy-5-ureidoimidazoline decarboxylase